MERQLGISELIADLQDAKLPFAIKRLPGFGRCLCLPGQASRPPSVSATGTRRSQAGQFPFANEVALRLRQRDGRY